MSYTDHSSHEAASTLRRHPHFSDFSNFCLWKAKLIGLLSRYCTSKIEVAWEVFFFWNHHPPSLISGKVFSEFVFLINSSMLFYGIYFWISIMSCLCIDIYRSDHRRDSGLGVELPLCAGGSDSLSAERPMVGLGAPPRHEGLSAGTHSSPRSCASSN